MGGLCFIFGILVTLGPGVGMFHNQLPEVLGPPQMKAGMMVLFLAFGSGLIGFPLMTLSRSSSTATSALLKPKR